MDHEVSNNANTSLSQEIAHASTAQFIEPEYLKILRIFIEVAVGLFGVAGNLLVCVAIATRKRLKTIANLFVFNLAVADLGVLLICLPLVVLHSDFPYFWPFGEVVCKVFYPFTDIFYGVSIGSIVAISFHRYRMIVHCMDRQLTSAKAKITILVIWLLSYLFFVLPVNLVMELKEVNGKTFCHPNWPKLIHRQLYVTLVFIIFYLLPLMIILSTYLRIRRKLSADSFLASQMYTGGSNTIKARLEQNKKALALLTPVVIAFASLMLPINAIRLLTSFHKLGTKLPYVRLIYNISVLLLLANSSINCVIYAVVNKDFRREFKRILCSGCLKRFWNALPSPSTHLPNDKHKTHSIFTTHDHRTVEEMVSIHETDSSGQTSHHEIPDAAQKTKGMYSKMLGHSEVRHLLKEDQRNSRPVQYCAYDEKLTIIVK